MLVLLPPSETKAAGGDDVPLRLEELALPELATPRAKLVRALVTLARNPKRAATVLGLGPSQLDEVARNAQLQDAPTMPAIERYTGVLYDALDVRGLARGARARANARLAVGSALFGVVRAGDPIPAYRLSAGTTLPRVGTIGSVWKPTLGPVLRSMSEQQLVVDLRSGAYQSLAPVPGAVTVRVLSERPDGSRVVVSHFNKASKGRLARLLAEARSEPSTIEDVARIARRGGFTVEQPGELRLDLVTAG